MFILFFYLFINLFFKVCDKEMLIPSPFDQEACTKQQGPDGYVYGRYQGMTNRFLRLYEIFIPTWTHLDFKCLTANRQFILTQLCPSLLIKLQHQTVCYSKIS